MQQAALPTALAESNYSNPVRIDWFDFRTGRHLFQSLTRSCHFATCRRRVHSPKSLPSDERVRTTATASKSLRGLSPTRRGCITPIVAVCQRNYNTCCDTRYDLLSSLPCDTPYDLRQKIHNVFLKTRFGFAGTTSRSFPFRLCPGRRRNFARMLLGRKRRHSCRYGGSTASETRFGVVLDHIETGSY